MLSEALTWYVQQMSELVPERFRARDTGPTNAFVVNWSEHSTVAAELRLRRDGKETSLGRFATDEIGVRSVRAMVGARRAPDTVLRLPPGYLLDRTVTLPLAAEQGLDRVIRYEMDRFTPFAADEVYHTHTIVRRDRTNGRLLATISLVPKARLEGILEALSAVGLKPTLLEGELQGGILRRIPLEGTRPTGERRRRIAFAALAVTCGILAMLAIVTPFWVQSQAMDDLDGRIDALAPRVKQAEALRARLAASVAGTDVTSAERARVGDALQIIAALTNVLPDDTHLTGLTLQRRQVTLEGQSASAARLIGLISAEPTMRNAAFAAPVTRGEGGVDLFSIKAEAVP